MATIVNIKKFNRHMYDYMDKLPLIVENAKTGQPKFIVLPPDERIITALRGGEEYGKKMATKDSD